MRVGTAYVGPWVREWMGRGNEPKVVVVVVVVVPARLELFTKVTFHGQILMKLGVNKSGF